MYLKNKEIESIQDETIVFQDGTQTVLSKGKQFYLITENELSDNEYELLEQKFMLGEIFNVFRNRNILLSFDNQKEVKDQADVDTAAEILTIMKKHEYQTLKLDHVFHNLTAYLTSINNLVQNNITAIQNEIVVKKLGLMDRGASDAERLRSLTVNDLERLLNS